MILFTDGKGIPASVGSATMFESSRADAPTNQIPAVVGTGVQSDSFFSITSPTIQPGTPVVSVGRLSARR